MRQTICVAARVGIVLCFVLAASPVFAQRAAAPAIPNAAEIAAGGNDTGLDMAPNTRLEVVNAAVAGMPDKLPPGPFEPTWDSLKARYKVPQWFADAKFGIFMHWGVYSVPAYRGGGASEWYETHLYGNGATLTWHTQNFGPLETFGYKDFIPLFKAEKYDPEGWAVLFKKSGAKFVIPTAQHHDNFSMWESKANPINAKNMGPKRDLIGDMAKAVRAQGLKFGVSNHGIEAFEFVKQNNAVVAALKAAQKDVFDPKWMEFYNADRSDAACQKFLVNWIARNIELIDQYQVDMLWFDNGVDQRFLDPLKLWIAAYYYNRAAQWGKEVSISTKKAAYAPEGNNVRTVGSIIDFEKIGSRSPAGIRTGVWQVDDPIGSNWGYADGMTVAAPASVIGRLVDTVSQNGTYLLNISPKSDGTIPENQQAVLLAIGQWLDVNGEAIYGSHNWSQFQDASGAGGRGGPHIRYTVKGDTLYAIFVGTYPATGITLAALGTAAALDGKITGVTMLGSGGDLKYSQDASGLHISPPAQAPCQFAYTLKITGLKTNADTRTRDGNPIN